MTIQPSSQPNNADLQRQLAAALFRSLKLQRVLFQVMSERDGLKERLRVLAPVLPDVPYINPLTLEEYT